MAQTGFSQMTKYISKCLADYSLNQMPYDFGIALLHFLKQLNKNGIILKKIYFVSNSKNLWRDSNRNLQIEKLVFYHWATVDIFAEGIEFYI